MENNNFSFGEMFESFLKGVANNANEEKTKKMEFVEAGKAVKYIFDGLIEAGFTENQAMRFIVSVTTAMALKK